MKVSYELNNEGVAIKEVKELLKPFGGRCAKIEGSTLVYQIKDENEQEALDALKEKGIVK